MRGWLVLSATTNLFQTEDEPIRIALRGDPFNRHLPIFGCLGQFIFELFALQEEAFRRVCQERLNQAQKGGHRCQRAGGNGADFKDFQRLRKIEFATSNGCHQRPQSSYLAKRLQLIGK